MASEPAPFFAGLHARWVFIQNNVRVTFDVTKGNFKPNVTKANDGVNGEPRDRLAVYVNYFEGSINTLQVDTQALEALLNNIENDDAGVLPWEKACGLVITPPSGRKASFQLTGLNFDDWDFSSQGRTERVGLVVPFRATRIRAVRTF